MASLTSVDYLAKCDGDCASANIADLKFFKIGGAGLIDGSAPPGHWAADDLIKNNNTWSVQIPSDIAPGNYVLRHEIIAMHASFEEGGAQNYPQCFNLEVSGSGTASPAGVAATELYTSISEGIIFDIYKPASSYPVPGPALYSGGGGSAPIVTAAPSSAAPTATAAPEESTAAPEVPSETSEGSAPVVTEAPSATIPPFQNGTLPIATSTRNSACKSKSRTTSAPTNTVPVPETTATVVPTPAEPTSVPAPGEPSPVPSPVESEAGDLPSGTTLASVLKWLSAFYAEKGDGEYVPIKAVKRRHSRHLNF